MTDSEKVKQVREKFLVKYNGSILDDTYDSRDVDWVKSSDGLIRCALKTFKVNGDVNKAVDLLNTVLLFRAKYRLNDLKESDLDADIRAIDGLKVHGKDKKGQKILIFNISKQKKGFKLEESKQFMAYHYNKHFRETPEEPIVNIMDMAGAGVSNLDLDLAKFVVLCNGTYFPYLSDYTLIFKMPVVLEVVWTIIKGFFDSDQNKKTHMVSRKNIQEYVAADQLLPHMIKENK